MNSEGMSGPPLVAAEAADLATGGGNATAGGVSFQGLVGASFVSTGLAERSLDARLTLGKAGVKSIRFETESPIDDLLIETTLQGRVFVQAKTSLSLSTSLDSELGKTAEQFVRQWRLCATGNGDKGWNLPLNRDTDRFVLAVGAGAPNTIAIDLSLALSRRQRNATSDVTPQSQTAALNKFSELLAAARLETYGTAAQQSDIDGLLDLCVVLRFDFAGADLIAASETLRSELANPDSAQSNFRSLAQLCDEHMAARTGGNMAQFRRQLEQSGVALLAAPDFRIDVEALRAFSERTCANLSKAQAIRFDTATGVHIDRPVATAAVRALAEGPLLLLGEPGAGKSGVLLSLGGQLASSDNEVVYLAVDGLPVSGSDGLRAEIGLKHPVREVLDNWPGTRRKLLLIDGLDAARGGPAVAVFRALIADTLQLSDKVWSVVASVRSFDLRLGRQYRELFKGRPTELDFTDPSFHDVRHVEVRAWDETELEELLLQAPALRSAIDAGGRRLRDLALVPFNTQLVADLVASGIEPTSLGQIANQSELLKVYWNYRVEQSGVEAEACLTDAVRLMILEKSLRVKQDVCRAAHAAALESLLASGVLVSQSGGRHIAFRHNILFDYAACRLYLDPYDLDALKVSLARSSGSGLLLGPAVGFAFLELWLAESDHAQFWSAVAALLKDETIDPIARSVIARLASDLPRTVDDIQLMIGALREAKEGPSIFGGIAGSLAIGLEDDATTAALPVWTSALRELSDDSRFLNAVSYLLSLLLKYPGVSEDPNAGDAARNLLRHAFALPQEAYARNLTHSGITFVANTYGTNAELSKSLLGEVFIAGRLGRYAHVEVPALASEVASIAAHDPNFAASFYGAVFAHKVTSKRTTSISGSQIMSLTSHEAQDYNMARWQLAKHFSDFLVTNPAAAAAAMVAAVEGYVASEHPLHESHGEWALPIEGQGASITATLVEDSSRYWAWDVMDSHPDDFQTITQEFVKWLRTADEAEVLQALEIILSQNRMALLWARLLMVGADRPALLAPRLWSLATNEHVLLCPDTTKDAIDAVAAFYSVQTEEQRRQFETSVETFDFNIFIHPDRARAVFMRSLFQQIDNALLVTELARSYRTEETNAPQNANPRPFVIESDVSSMVDENWWLREQGVDVTEPVHEAILAYGKRVIEEMGIVPGQSLPKISDLPSAVQQLSGLMDALDAAQTSGVNREIVRLVEGNLANCCSAVLCTKPGVSALSEAELNRIEQIALRLSRSDFPGAEQGVEEAFERSQHWGGPAARVDAVVDLYRLSQIKPSIDPLLLDRLDALKTDPHPAVRLTVAQHMSVLWNKDQARMWGLADHFAGSENNQGVLIGLTNSFLGSVRNFDPAHVETIVLQLNQRFPDEAKNDERQVRHPIFESVASLTAMLSVWNNRAAANELLLDWAKTPAIYEDHLSAALFAVKEAMIEGYDEERPEREMHRMRSQAFLRATVVGAAAGLRAYLGDTPEGRAARASEVAPFAKTMDNACNAIYFSSGALGGRHVPGAAGITTDAGKARMLADLKDVLLLMGEVGTPHTMYQLLQLLEFTLPADPALSFDLLSHAMLNGGKRHGYQLDFMGTEVFVRFVGRCIADFRQIFLDDVRRAALIECLDLFIEAGWPSARRLLYRLPEALQ